MIPADQALIRAGDLARELGINPSTLSRWANSRPDIRGARIARGKFSVQRLRDCGLLPRVEATR